jgi:hypothetical protein
MAMNWIREGEKLSSAQGYVITRTKNVRDVYFYNLWTPAALNGRVIEAGYGADGLARCKSAAERHWEAQAAEKAKEAV